MVQYDNSQFLDPKASYRVVNLFQQRWQESGYDYRDRPRPECGLLLVIQGTITYCWEGARLEAAAGDLLFLPKGCHYEVVTTSARDFLVNFQTTAQPLPGHPLRLLTGTSQALADSFRRLVELKLQSKQRSFQSNGQFYLLLDQLATELRRQESSLLDTALPLLAETELSIAQVAAACGISESGFRAAFRKAKGSSPLQYRLSCKLTRAKYLLESSDLSVQQIAQTLHFYDEAYFCKLFRQKVGMSPKAYAKNQKL